MSALLLVITTLLGWTGAHAQSAWVQASFATRCDTCWPGWAELQRPIGGLGPSVSNREAAIFVSGWHADPALNQEHLLFNGPQASAIRTPAEAAASFRFGNATVGGRRQLTDGSFLCLQKNDVMAYVTEEVFIITLRDTGPTWLGAFIGDVTLLDPSVVPATESRQLYTTIGLLEQTASGPQVLAVKVIPPVTRFSQIHVQVQVNEHTGDSPILDALFMFADGRQTSVQSALGPASVLSTGTAGVIYLVGNGWPCTTLTQREVAVRSFALR
jgi:hypothetical protein